MANADETVVIDIQLETDDTVKSMRQMREEYKALLKQMDEAAAKGDKQQFNALKKSMGELKNDMKDLRIEMNAMDPGELLSGFTKMAQGAVGSFAAITGAMQLFGGESKKMDEIQKKSIILIQTMMGLESARQLLIDQGGKAQLKAMFATAAAQVKQIALGAKVVAMNALQTLGIIKQTAATQAATAAQLAFNKAAQASLYAAMAAAVLYLADLYYTGWKRAQEFNDAHLQGQKIIADYTKDLQEMKKEMDNYIASLTIAIGAYRDLGQETIAMQGDVTKALSKVVNAGTIMQRSGSKAVKDLGVAVVNLGADFNNFNKKAATEMIGKLDDLKNGLKNTDAAGRDLTDANKTILAAIDDAIAGLGEEAKATEALTARRNKTTTATKDHTKALEKDTKALRDWNKEMNEFLSKKLDEALQKPVSLFTFDPNALKLYYQLRAENEALTEKERVDALINLEEIRYNEELELAGEYGPAREEVERKHQANLVKIRAEGLNATKEAEEKFRKWSELNDMERIDRLKEYVNTIASYASQTTDIILAFQRQSVENQIIEIGKLYDQSQSEYNRLLKENLISQEEYDRLSAINQEEKTRKENDQKRKSFEQEKTAQIVNATIQTLMAVLNAYSSGMAYPMIGPATAAVFAGLAGAFGAAQIALIAGEKNPYARGGLISGKPHAQGGEDINVEGGEVVLNKKAMEIPQYRLLANAMNTSTGGATIPMTGMNGNSVNSSPVEANISEATIEKIVSKIANIPVIVSERDITKTQRRVAVIEKRVTI